MPRSAEALRLRPRVRIHKRGDRLTRLFSDEVTHRKEAWRNIISPYFSYVFCLRSLCALDDLKFNRIAFLQAPISIA